MEKCDYEDLIVETVYFESEDIITDSIQFPDDF